MKFPGDAWEGAVLENGFLEEEAQNFPFGARSVLTLKTTISNFGAALIYLCFASPNRPLLDMESIGNKLICDIIVQMLSELSTFVCVPIS